MKNEIQIDGLYLGGFNYKDKKTSLDYVAERYLVWDKRDDSQVYNPQIVIAWQLTDKTAVKPFTVVRVRIVYNEGKDGKIYHNIVGCVK